MDAKKQKILAVDDSLTVRKFTEMVLGKEGYEVEIAENGAECLEKVPEFEPELILLDFVLPDMPSNEICDSLYNMPAGRNVPILMISSNGNAIRQMYQNCPNVKDYLTKPFQANILTSVVGHVLEKAAKEAEEAVSASAVFDGAEAEAEQAVETPAAETKEEVVVADAAPVAASEESAAAATSGSSVSEELITEEFVCWLKGLMESKFKVLAKFIPDLEQKRGNRSAERYYLNFFVRPRVVSDLAKGLMTYFREERGVMTSLAAPSSLISTDSALIHLASIEATGILELDIPGERVTVFFQNGQVAAITSNNPKAYCMGSAFTYRGLTKSDITKSVVAQRRRGVPFFVTVHKEGKLEASDLSDLLRVQGEKTIVRGLTATTAEYRFIPREADKLPDYVLDYSLNLPVRQLILNVYRGVEDWLTIESAIGNFDSILSRKPEFASALKSLEILKDEMDVLELVDGRISVHEIINWSGLTAFKVCGVLYRFIKMGVLQFIYTPLAEEEAEQPGRS